MIGVPADSDMENRFTLLVSPQMREANGIQVDAVADRLPARTA